MGSFRKGRPQSGTIDCVCPKGNNCCRAKSGEAKKAHTPPDTRIRKCKLEVKSRWQAE